MRKDLMQEGGLCKLVEALILKWESPKNMPGNITKRYT
jgi:hypothetical protein